MGSVLVGRLEMLKSFVESFKEVWLPRRKKNAGSPKGVQAPARQPAVEKIEAAEKPIELGKAIALAAAQANSYQGYMQQSLFAAQQQAYVTMGSASTNSFSIQPKVEMPRITGVKVKENPDGTFCLEFQNTGQLGVWVITSVPDGIMRSLHKQWLMERNKKEDDDAGL
jgi:hypothetical protein